MAADDVLSRDVLKWLQSLDLTYPVKNVRRAFSNGFLVAEVLSHYSSDIAMHAFDNGTALKRKLANWEMLKKFFVRTGIAVTDEMIDGVIHAKAGAAPPLIELLYSTLTNRPVRKAAATAASAAEDPNRAPTPAYAKPTAARLISQALTTSERELVQDREIVAAINEETLHAHEAAVRQERAAAKRSGAVGTKASPGGATRGAAQARAPSSSSRAGPRSSPPVVPREVQVRDRSQRAAAPSTIGDDDDAAGNDDIVSTGAGPQSMRSSAGRGLLGASGGGGGGGSGGSGRPRVLAMLNEVVQTTLRESDIFAQFTSKHDDLISTFVELLKDIPANLAGAVFVSILARAIDFAVLFLRESPVPIAPSLYDPSVESSGIEFAAFCRVMLAVLQYSPALGAFEHAVHVLSSVGQHLVTLAPDAAWALFAEIALPRLVARLATSAEGQGSLLRVILSFADNTPAAHHAILAKIVEYDEVLSKKAALVPCLLQLFRMEAMFDNALLTAYAQHADAGLAHPSAVVRIAALSLLTNLCTNAAIQRSIGAGLLAPSAVLDFTLPYVDHLRGLAGDANWQVQAQLVCLVAMLLDALPPRHPSERVLHALVAELCTPYAPISVKKIALSVLAGALHAHPPLAASYVAVLLSLPHSLRDSLLRADAVPFLVPSQVPSVPHYTLPPPTQSWPPSAIAAALLDVVQRTQLEALEREHVAVLRVAVRSEPRGTELASASTWARVWTSLYQFVLVSLCDEDVAPEAVGVLDELLSLFPQLVMDTLTTHQPTLIGTLRMLVRVGSAKAQQCMADWLASLYRQGGPWQQVVGQLMLTSTASEVGVAGSPLHRLQKSIQDVSQR